MRKPEIAKKPSTATRALRNFGEDEREELWERSQEWMKTTVRAVVDESETMSKIILPHRRQ